jgi:thiol-disulfide isomerase/thioredoxin
MGRLQIVGLTILAACACEADPKKAPSAPRERSQAIADLAPAAPASTQATVAAPASASAKPTAPRVLCDGQLGGQGKPFPKKPVGRSAAVGAAELPETLAVGAGKWTWVNFWAAWCVPCKEEIPRLQRFEQQLTRAGKAFRLAFVTLDDDPRQLEKFLAGQTPEGLRSSYWLREGKERDEWLQAAGMEPDPALPVHLLVDPLGKVRCTVKGAIEDGDYSRIAALVDK